MPESAKIQFTPAQSAAITARGGSLLVSAAAGSGKTRVLVERVVGLITDPIHPVEADSLLIMTFTNAAAAKLRADITTRLAEEVRAHPGDMRLRRQQLLRAAFRELAERLPPDLADSPAARTLTEVSARQGRRQRPKKKAAPEGGLFGGAEAVDQNATRMPRLTPSRPCWSSLKRPV